MNGYPQMKLYRSASVSERHYVSTVNRFESGTELFNPLWQAAGIWLFLLADWPSQCDPEWWRPVVLKVTGLVLDNLEGLQLSKVFKDLHNCRKSEKQLWSSREDEIKTLRTYQVDLFSIQSKGTELEDQQCLKIGKVIINEYYDTSFVNWMGLLGTHSLMRLKVYTLFYLS